MRAIRRSTPPARSPRRWRRCAHGRAPPAASPVTSRARWWRTPPGRRSAAGRPGPHPRRARGHSRPPALGVACNAPGPGGHGGDDDSAGSGAGRYPGGRDMDEQVLVATRRALHAVAEQVLAGPQYRSAGTIRLTVTPGGFGQVKGPLRVEGDELVGERGRVPLRGTTTELAAAVA